jgi:uncharacterized membrane protein
VVLGEFFVLEGYNWSASAGLRHLPGAPSRPMRVSADGSIAVGGATVKLDGGSSQVPARWLNQGSTLSVVDSRLGTVLGMSADGLVMVGVMVENHASTVFRWTPGSGTTSLFTVTQGNEIVDLSADGSTILLAQSRWTNEHGLEPLPCTGACQTVALSSRGRIVALQDLNTESFLVWDVKHGARSLPDLLTAHGVAQGGWLIRSINDMSDDGRVFVGMATRGSARRGYRAVLPANAFD